MPSLLLRFLIAFFGALPAMEKIVETLQKDYDEWQRRQADANFDKAAAQAKLEKDTSELEKAFHSTGPASTDSVPNSKVPS